MRLTVTYESAEQLIAADEQQWSKGGLLVEAANPPELARDTPLTLRIETPFGEAELAATVMQVLPGMGVAVSFDRGEPSLQGLLGQARGDGGKEAVDGEREFVRRYVPNPAVDARSRYKNASQVEKMQIALHGNREDRNLVLRDTNRSLHQYVLKNAKIQIDEVATIAGLRTVSPEVLAFIAGRREWSGRPEVALALVRNPKTPLGLAVKMVENCSPTALRQLAKVAGLRAPVLRAVRRKVLR